MTTPTLLEAAELAERAAIDSRFNDDAQAGFIFAANTLRALASAQSDAESEAMDYFDSLNWHRAPDEYETAIYLAGHAQGCAAGLAASSAKVKELEAELELRDRMIRALNEIEGKAEAALATARADLEVTEAKIRELKDELRCPDCGCASPEDAEASECGCDSAVCERDGGKTLARHFVDAKADALEMANEVRRCHALAQDADDRICEGDVAGFALFGDACHEMIDNRPAAVTAAMERYAETQHG